MSSRAMAAYRPTIKQEPEVLIVEHDDDEPEVFDFNQIQNDSVDDEDDTGASSSFTTESYDPEQLASYSISEDAISSATMRQLDTLSAMEPETIISEVERWEVMEHRKPSKNKESNAASMRDYRRRIRADPIRYELYKQRERVRNKKRCDLRRLQKKMVSEGITPELAQTIELSSLLPPTRRTSKVKSYDIQEPFDVMTTSKRGRPKQNLPSLHNLRPRRRNVPKNVDQISDSDPDVDIGNEINFPKVYIKEEEHIERSLTTGRQIVGRKTLPTKEVSITIPKKNSSVLKQLTENGIHARLPEIDIFVRDPKTSERVPINGLPISITKPYTDDVVDLTSEHSDNESEDPLSFNHRLSFEPQIEIVEYQQPTTSTDISIELPAKRSTRSLYRPNRRTTDTVSVEHDESPAVTITPVPMTGTRSYNTNGNGEVSSSKSKGVRSKTNADAARSKVTAEDSANSGYIDSYMTFVSRKMEEEERQSWTSIFNRYL